MIQRVKKEINRWKCNDEDFFYDVSTTWEKLGLAIVLHYKVKDESNKIEEKKNEEENIKYCRYWTRSRDQDQLDDALSVTGEADLIEHCVVGNSWFFCWRERDGERLMTQHDGG